MGGKAMEKEKREIQERYRRVIRALELDEYSGEEIEDLGKQLVKTFLKYTSKMSLKGGKYVYDFSIKDVSKISEVSINLLEGIDYEDGLNYYKTDVESYLEVVGSLEIKKDNSMKEKYQESVINDIDKFMKISNTSKGYWD